MKTSDVKVNKTYLMDSKEVTVLRRIPGMPTSKRNMQSGILCTGIVRTKKSFLLDTGDVVFSDKLKPDVKEKETE